MAPVHEKSRWRFWLWWIGAWVVVPLWTAQPAVPPASHPWLFLTAADVQRARQGISQNEDFARLAEQLIHRARTESVEALPPLDRDWWETARQKPWGQIYPEIFHHTFIVPQRWADLARTCARAQLLTDASELATKGKRLLLALSEYTFEFEHYDVGMNYTLWTVSALDAYDILYEQFMSEERARMDAFFERLLQAVLKNDQYWVKHEPGGKLNNHYAWHKLCLTMIGLFYQRPELVQDAWHGPKGVAYMLKEGFKDDGLWCEGAIPYQFAATAALLLTAQILDHAAYPVKLFGEHPLPGQDLKGSYDALIPLLFPDRTLPTIGDCYGRRPHLGQHPDWEILYARFRAPVYAWLLRDSDQRHATALFNGLPELPNNLSGPVQVSRTWPEMGYVALRSVEGTNYWSGQGWSVFATYSNRPVHENRDKLSMIVFADGHLWLPDCEAKPSAEHAFSASVQARLNRETLCHNTLLIDRRSQASPGRPLQLLEFQSQEGLKQASFGDLTGQLYPGVRQLRTVLACPDYVLDFFQVASGEPHDLAWMIHVDGRPAACSVKHTQPKPWPSSPPWSYLRNPITSGGQTNYWEVFSHEERLLRVDVLSDNPVEVVQCQFPLNDSADPDTIPMRLLQRRAATAWFLAVYRRVLDPKDAVDLNVLLKDGSAFTVSMDGNGRTLSHEVPALDAIVPEQTAP